MNQSSIRTPSFKGYVTPALLRQYYNLSNSVLGSSDVSQAVFNALNQSLSPSDLRLFQKTFNLPASSIANSVNGHVFDGACIAQGGTLCVEANLDVQYITAIAPYVPTTFYYNEERGIVGWIKEVYSSPVIANVYSIRSGQRKPSCLVHFLFLYIPFVDFD